MPKNKPYDPSSQDLFKISRTGVELFMDCERCFYLRYKKAVSRVSGFPFNLNIAVDSLLKNEFDDYRRKGEPHPLMIEASIDAIPFQHEHLDQWRFNFTGVQFKDTKRGFMWFGAIDDVWIHNKTKKLIIADYKATSKKSEVNLDADWQIAYKRQMEFYQWLMRANGFEVEDEGWFVYCNGIVFDNHFNGQLSFDIKMIPYQGDDGWIEPTLDNIKTCLDSEITPSANANCKYCKYINNINLASK